MSKLLIKSRGNASQSFAAPGGGVILGPSCRVSQTDFDFSNGVDHILVAGSDGATNDDVVAVKSLSTGQCIYQRNAHAITTTGFAKTVHETNGLTFEPGGNSETFEFTSYAVGATNHITGKTVEGFSSFRAGISPAFFIQAKFNLTTANRSTIHVGFRKKEDDQDAITDYDELFAVMIKAGGTDTNNQLAIKAGSAVASDVAMTGITNSAGSDQELEVRVSAAGVCSILVDGKIMNATDHAFVPMTMTQGIEVVPYIRVARGGSGAATVNLKSLMWGYQEVLA